MLFNDFLGLSYMLVVPLHKKNIHWCIQNTFLKAYEIQCQVRAGAMVIANASDSNNIFLQVIPIFVILIC